MKTRAKCHYDRKADEGSAMGKCDVQADILSGQENGINHSEASYSFCRPEQFEKETRNTHGSIDTSKFPTFRYRNGCVSSSNIFSGRCTGISRSGSNLESKEILDNSRDQVPNNNVNMSHERDYVSSASCARIPAELDPYTFDERCENGASSLQSFDNKKGSTHLLEGKPGKSISSSTQKRTKRKRIETDEATEQEEESSRLEHLSLTAKHEMTDESSHAALPIRRKRKANPGTSQTQDSVSSTKSSRHVDHDSVYEESTDLLSAAREEQLKTGFKLRKMRRKYCQELPRTMAFGNEKVLAEEPIMLQQRNIDTLRVGCNNESVICIDAVEPETFDVDLEISPTKPHISVNQEVLSEQAISAIVAPSEISLENEDFPEHTVKLKNRNSSDRIVAEKRKPRNRSRQSKPKKRSRKTGKFLGNSTVKSAPETGMKPLPEDNDETPSNPGSPSMYNELLNTGFHENLQSDSSSQPTSDELFDRLLAEAKNCTKKTVTFADNLLIPDDFDPLPPNPSIVPVKPSIVSGDSKFHVSNVRVTSERLDTAIDEILRIVKTYVKYNTDFERQNTIDKLISMKGGLVTVLEAHKKWLITVQEAVQSISRSLELIKNVCDNDSKYCDAVARMVKIFEALDKRTAVSSSAIGNVPRSFGELREKIAVIWNKLTSENRDGSETIIQSPSHSD